MKLLSFFFLLVFIPACKPGIPKNVLPPDKMRPVLWDMLEADEIREYYGPAADSSLSRILKHAEYYQVIFRIHKTTEQDFKTSMHFYMGHPALFKPILDSLQAAADRTTTTNMDSSYNKYKHRLPDSVKKRPPAN
jgi:hypothetical protein